MSALQEQLAYLLDGRIELLNARFGELLPAAMDRETHHCVRLFEERDAREALHAFAGRRRMG